MRTNARRLVATAGICALLTSASLAQPQDSAPPAKGSAPRAVTPPNGAAFPTPDREFVTFDFPGGKVSDFIAMLRAAMAPMPLNVFVDAEAAKQSLPAIKLTNASYFNVLRLLDRTEFEEQGRLVQTRVSQVDTSEGQTPIFKIQAGVQGGERTTGFSVLSLNPIIGLPGSAAATGSHLDAKSVLAAVEAAVIVSDDQSSSPPILKFHEPSGLLFVRGTEYQRKAAEEVVQQLRKDVEAARQTSQRGFGNDGEKRLIIPAEQHGAILKALHQRFDGQCCIQFVFEGDTLRITGDKELLDEAAAIAFTRTLQLGETPSQTQK